MSYFRNPSKRSSPGALGDLASTITNIASTVGIAADLANDPYLPETVCRVGQLKALNNKQRPGTCQAVRDGMPGGVGLRKLIKPLRGYVYAQEHKWTYAAAAGVVIGLPLLLGYALGKGSR